MKKPPPTTQQFGGPLVGTGGFWVGEKVAKNLNKGEGQLRTRN